MGEGYYREYSPGDMEEIVKLQLRESDKEELEAATGWPWEVALLMSLRFSERKWVVVYNDKIEAVFGVQDDPIHEGAGIPWFVATNKFGSFAYRFAKKSKEVIKMWLQEYSLLWNYVYAKHFEAIRWLKWLGFTVTEDYVYRYDKDVPFRKFLMQRR